MVNFAFFHKIVEPYLEKVKAILAKRYLSVELLKEEPIKNLKTIKSMCLYQAQDFYFKKFIGIQKFTIPIKINDELSLLSLEISNNEIQKIDVVKVEEFLRTKQGEKLIKIYEKDEYKNIPVSREQRSIFDQTKKISAALTFIEREH